MFSRPRGRSGPPSWPRNAETLSTTKQAMENAGIIISSGALGAICTLCATWIKARYARKVEGEVKADVPQPLSVELKERFVTKETFRDHCNRIETALKDHAQDNERNFEALYNLVRANDKLTATIAGTLEAIKGDLALIKDKLFRKAR